MRKSGHFLAASLLAVMAPAMAAPAAEMHPLNDGYVVATFQKYVGPEIYLCPDEQVNKKKDICGAQMKGLSAQQYLDGRFGPRRTRVVGLQPGRTATKVVILYQIYRGGLDGSAAH